MTGPQIGAGVLLLAGLMFLLWLVNYSDLLFHTLVEFLAIGTALAVGVVAWHTYPLSRNNLILALGLALTAVSVLDLAHVFSEKGMRLLRITPPDLSTQMWLAARYFQATVFVLAPLLLYGPLAARTLHVRRVATGMAAVSLSLLLLVIFGYFPATHVRKVGDTPFTVYSEFIITVLFAGGMANLWLYRKALDPRLFRLVFLAMLCTMMGMFVLVLDIQAYKFSRIAGHVCPLVAAGLILRASLMQGLEEPVQFLNRALDVMVSSRNALVHSRDEESLLGSICETAVSKGGYRLAWVGFLENDAAQTIRPVKFAGDERGYLDEVQFSVADSALGQAVRTGRPVFANGAAEQTAWQKANLRHGFAASLALPLRASDRPVFGVLVLHSDNPHAFSGPEFDFLCGLAEDLGHGVHARRSCEDRDLAELRATESMARLSRSVRSTVNALAFTVEKRDPYTAGHQRRVADLATSIGRRLGLPEQSVEALTMGGLIHDIGKIYIPAEILNRPGHLTEREFEIIRTHPEVGHDIIVGVEFPWPVAPMIMQHHERIDGSGYPHHLKGKEIGLEARIIAVADVMEAMASHRPYRASLGMETALVELRKNAGTQFDADVVSACECLFQKDGYRFPCESTGGARESAGVV